MGIKLICVHAFHGYERGQEVIDPEEVAAHLDDREHHFVKVAMTPADDVRLLEMREAAKADADEAMAKAAANLPKPPPEADKAPPAKGRHAK